MSQTFSLPPPSRGVSLPAKFRPSFLPLLVNSKKNMSANVSEDDEQLNKMVDCGNIPEEVDNTCIVAGEGGNGKFYHCQAIYDGNKGLKRPEYGYKVSKGPNMTIIKATHIKENVAALKTKLRKDSTCNVGDFIVLPQEPQVCKARRTKQQSTQISRSPKDLNTSSFIPVIHYRQKFVKGCTLQDVLKQGKTTNCKQGQPLSQSDIIGLYLQVCFVLSWLHEFLPDDTEKVPNFLGKNFMHNDFKSDNVIVTEEATNIVLQGSILNFLKKRFCKLVKENKADLQRCESISDDVVPDYENRKYTASQCRLIQMANSVLRNVKIVNNYEDDCEDGVPTVTLETNLKINVIDWEEMNLSPQNDEHRCNESEHQSLECFWRKRMGREVIEKAFGSTKNNSISPRTPQHSSNGSKRIGKNNSYY